MFVIFVVFDIDIIFKNRINIIYYSYIIRHWTLCIQDFIM